MKKHLKWLIPVLCIAFIFVSFGAYLSYMALYTPKKLSHTLDYVCVEYGDINVYDPEDIVASSDYVFVGYVRESHDCYTERFYRSFPKEVRNAANNYSPETEYVVEVEKNVKGELKLNEKLSFYKGCGKTKGGRSFVIYDERDIVPELGKYYVFAGNVTPNGVMFSNVIGTYELEENIYPENLDESEVYKTYVAAFESSQKYFAPDNAKHYLSVADVNYGDGSYNEKLFIEEEKKRAERDAEAQSRIDAMNEAENLSNEVTTEKTVE